MDVYSPSGELALVFRVGALKSTIPVSEGGKLTDEGYKYWRWVAKTPPGTDQRGMAAGKELHTQPENRLTLGQWEFFLSATRGKNPVIDEEEARQIIDSNPEGSRNTYYIGKVEEDGFVDMEEVKKWHSIVRKSSVQGQARVEATANRNRAKLAWFEKWFETVWVPSKDRAATAAAAKKRYITGQPRSNKAFSSLMGFSDRSGRIPYGRLTARTEARWDEFAGNTPFYLEVNDIFKETMPVKFDVLNERFKQVKDMKYNLFGTAFTTITVNYNFQVAYHRDGNNAKNAVAAIAVMGSGDWSGGEFVFPELRLGFNVRQGDILIGDNQKLIHGMLPFNHSDMRWGDYGHKGSAEHIMFVFYQRDNIINLDDFECESCRKDFMKYCVTNLREKDKGEATWGGSWPGMWTSDEWQKFKASKGMERCSDTNRWQT